ncbi:ATPase, T2SS/T4P/T4SS family [Pyrococcus sp. ST04]|uniref:ATPase, T2SS/T4P/T4SS family n=1 Tax=Pyrococcus sp. ST04 TaxID=1183377 RepID=UPI0002605F79|nr:putative type II secretion system protein [Pyrococcus sp. ST04]
MGKSLTKETRPAKEEKPALPLAFIQEPSAPKLEEILKKPEPQPEERRPIGPTLQEILSPTGKPGRYIGEVKVLDVYGNVRILKVKGEAVPIYEINLPKLSKEEEKLLKMVRDRAIVEIQIDPESIPNYEERRRVFMREVRKMVKEMAPTLSEGRVELLAELIVQNMIGYGKLDPLVRDDNLEEIMVIGLYKPVYVWHRRFGMCKTNISFSNEREILNIIERIAREVGRRIDQQNPLLDARLPDGSRVNATLPPISLDGPTLTIRKFKKDPLTIIDLIKYGTMNSEVAAFLWLLVDGLGVKPANILVAGGTGSGKTTTLNSLAMFIPPSERVISIEDTAELQLPIEHWVRLETRPPNVEGKGEITMDDLVKNTLRMRPDRIIVGEVRGPEARTMFTAMNTGHDGALYGFSVIQLSDGRVEFIGNLVDRLFEKYSNKVRKYKDLEFIELEEKDVFEVVSVGPDLKARKRRVTRVWRRKVKRGEKLILIKTKAGNEIILTKDHPVFTFLHGDILRKEAENLKPGDRIAMLLSIGVHSDSYGSIPSRSYEYSDFTSLGIEVSGIGDNSAVMANMGHEIGVPQISRGYENVNAESFIGDSIPVPPLVMKTLRERLNLTRAELSKLVSYYVRENIPEHVIESIEDGKTREIGRDILRGISLAFQRIAKDIGDKESLILAKKLEIISKGDIYWDEVVSVQEIDPEAFGVKYLYDLTVEGYHNYIANGILVSNCMGTIHSNSARETIVRLESPPMNVPRIMIPALDIIIMQVRYHTRKKGTIRRITEIAEVSGIEGESVQLNFLYKYDPAKDELIRTEVPSRFITTLSYHTGMSIEELKLEIEKRKLILDWMIEKGIRKIEEVGAQIREFYIDEEEFLKKIEREAATIEMSKKVKEFI